MAIKDIKIKKGSSFEFLALINDQNGAPLDMTGYTGGTAGARGKIRKNESATAALVSFTIVILNKTGVVAAVAAGQCHATTEEIAALKADTFGKCYILATITSTDTAALVGKTAIYDIEIEDKSTPAFVFPAYEGTVEMRGEATK